MSEFSDNIAIVFPTSWPDVSDEVEFPHCTLIYLGEISEASFTKEDVESVLNRLRIKSPGSYAIEGLELFGPDENVLVATLDKDEKLQATRDSIERALNKIGSGNASEYKEYRPHVTINTNFDGNLDDAKNEIELPSNIVLSEPVLWWGDERP